MPTHKNKESGKKKEDFLLERKPSNFRETYSRKSVFLASGACCCCCCWHVIGALIGAYLGGTIGSGIGYSKLRKNKENLSKYRWLLLFSALSTAVLVGVLFAISHLDIFVPLLPLVISLGIWALAINPCICFLAARKFSWRLLLLSLLFSLLGTVIGYGIGWAVLSFY